MRPKGLDPGSSRLLVSAPYAWLPCEGDSRQPSQGQVSWPHSSYPTVWAQPGLLGSGFPSAGQPLPWEADIGVQSVRSPCYTQDHDGDGGVARPFCLHILDPESSLGRRCLDPLPPPQTSPLPAPLPCLALTGRRGVSASMSQSLREEAHTQLPDTWGWGGGSACSASCSHYTSSSLPTLPDP